MRERNDGKIRKRNPKKQEKEPEKKKKNPKKKERETRKNKTEKTRKNRKTGLKLESKLPTFLHGWNGAVHLGSRSSFRSSIGECSDDSGMCLAEGGSGLGDLLLHFSQVFIIVIINMELVIVSLGFDDRVKDGRTQHAPEDIFSHDDPV